MRSEKNVAYLFLEQAEEKKTLMWQHFNKVGKYDNHILKYNRNTGIVDCRKCKEHNKIKDFRNSSKSQKTQR